MKSQQCLNRFKKKVYKLTCSTVKTWKFPSLSNMYTGIDASQNSLILSFNQYIPFLFRQIDKLTTAYTSHTD